MQDEGYHEIQLNGKQLVFLFMAATVVAVVIFLCGVMVGRGVPATRATTDIDAPGQLTLEAAQPPAVPSAPSVGGTVPATNNEDLTYGPRLESPTPVVETLKPSSESAPSAVADGPSPASAPAPASRPGFVVQVAAVRKRAEAEAIARQLVAKGYPTFVTTSGANFRVRVGKYDDRSDAEAVAGRLERNEHFKPWITR